MNYVDQMIKANQAYPCFCTDEELDAMRKDAELEGRPPVYNGADPCSLSACFGSVNMTMAQRHPGPQQCRMVLPAASFMKYLCCENFAPPGLAQCCSLLDRSFRRSAHCLPRGLASATKPNPLLSQLVPTCWHHERSRPGIPALRFTLFWDHTLP